MPYKIRANSGRFHMRDFGADGKPVYPVGDDWVPFMRLPHGIGPRDSQVEVVEISAEEYAKLPKPETVKQKQARKAAEKASAKDARQAKALAELALAAADGDISKVVAQAQALAPKAKVSEKEGPKPKVR